MLTPRGWNFLVLNLALLVGSLAFEVASVTLIALTLLIWFLGNWLTFAVRMRLTAGRLIVERELTNPHGPVRNFWAQGHFTVRLTLRSRTSVALPYARVTERLPLLVEKVGGVNETDGPISAS